MYVIVIVAILVAVYCSFDMNLIGIRNISNRILSRYNISTSVSNGSLIKRQAISVLKQERQALVMLAPDDYIKKCPTFFNASVGSHVRHLMDHYDRVVYSHKNPSSTLSYDERKRDTPI